VRAVLAGPPPCPSRTAIPPRGSPAPPPRISPTHPPSRCPRCLCGLGTLCSRWRCTAWPFLALRCVSSPGVHRNEVSVCREDFVVVTVAAVHAMVTAATSEKPLGALLLPSCHCCGELEVQSAPSILFLPAHSALEIAERTLLLLLHSLSHLCRTHVQ